MRRFIDITRPLGPMTLVYPGDPPVRIEVCADPRQGAPARVTYLCASSHAGTHMDAPCHLPGGKMGVESLPLEAMIGPAIVIDAPSRLIGGADVEALAESTPPRVLFRGSPVLSREAATAMAQNGILLVGTDGISIDPIGDPGLPAHRVLLEAGVVVLEGLDLSGAPAGAYDLFAMPLLIPGADGAPARAALRSR